MKFAAHFSLAPTQRASAAESYARDGFLLAPPSIPADLLQRVRRAIDDVYRGDYETGIPPAGHPVSSDKPPTSLVKIDNAHRSNRAILELVTHPAVGEWAAAITGAKFVQIFATQLLIKPPSPVGRVNVGWHQDQEYWDAALHGELFTAWVAISDVTPESGPMRFVRGSHQWGLLKAGDFFSDNLDALKKKIHDLRGGEAWDEVPAVLPPGAFSFHHRLTVHGSGPNVAPHPRVSFAIHLRTEKSGLRDGVRLEDTGYLNPFDDPIGSPVCYGKLPSQSHS